MVLIFFSGELNIRFAGTHAEYVRLSAMVRKWEKVNYPHPIPVNPLIAKIQERMAEQNLKQKDTAILLGIDEARMSEIL